MRRIVIIALLLLAACHKTVTLPTYPGQPMVGTRCQGHVYAVNGAKASTTCDFIFTQFAQGDARYKAVFPHAQIMDFFAVGGEIIFVPPDSECSAATPRICVWVPDGTKTRGMVAWYDVTSLPTPIIWHVDQSTAPPRPPEAHDPHAFDHEKVHGNGKYNDHPEWGCMEHYNAQTGNCPNDPFRGVQ